MAAGRTNGGTTEDGKDREDSRRHLCFILAGAVPIVVVIFVGRNYLFWLAGFIYSTEKKIPQRSHTRTLYVFCISLCVCAHVF